MDCGNGNADKTVMPIKPAIKNNNPAAYASARVLSCRHALRSVRILQAKKNPAVTGSNCTNENSSCHGLITTSAPTEPTIILVMRHRPTISPSTGPASRQTKIGYVYNPAAISVTDKNGAPEKKKNIVINKKKARK